METRVVFTDVAGTFVGSVLVGCDFFNEWIASEDPKRFFEEGGKAHVTIGGDPMGDPVDNLKDLLEQVDEVPV
jgi:hypothetical protein